MQVTASRNPRARRIVADPRQYHGDFRASQPTGKASKRREYAARKFLSNSRFETQHIRWPGLQPHKPPFLTNSHKRNNLVHNWAKHHATFADRAIYSDCMVTIARYVAAVHFVRASD